MREIKFRAWRQKFKNDKPEMVFYPNIQTTFEDSLVFDTYEDSHYIDESIGKFVLFELMQYTGLKDKNGKEIYEGDIYESKTVGGKIMHQVVVWENSGYRIKDGLFAEVIGNVYENPELLK